ncbi:rhomboid family intramembrane serine protease [Shewanella dokdonensis]|uniref:Rhomboid family intramembrane serine protease n=1 Tax=Shewanella dokdonensis TaxID=712036 RepID=A0ABX8DCQ2_9GAMM|nr:rhomboid family intramembrane serine protease [Shewanella dokdonensis]MCL1074467.1 rhomboid family intramembrane serine protease [Shewanella dokdonensis]QVK22496.1 rhomboid family intramembrane serine protease [Shewanella dokdonensis]
MTFRRLPYMAILLALATVIVSLAVNYLISGSFFGKVKVPELEPYGGYTLEHVLNYEFWRLIVSQLIHVKQPHMIYNVLSLVAIGFIFERKIGSAAFISIWLVAGSIGTFASTFTVPEPWNLGTGGSQAVLGLAAAGLVKFLKGEVVGRITLLVLVLTILPVFALDLIFSEHHLPKLGHILSFSFGALILFGFELRARFATTKLLKSDG